MEFNQYSFQKGDSKENQNYLINHIFMVNPLKPEKTQADSYIHKQLTQYFKQSQLEKYNCPQTKELMDNFLEIQNQIFKQQPYSFIEDCKIQKLLTDDYEKLPPFAIYFQNHNSGFVMKNYDENYVSLQLYNSMAEGKEVAKKNNILLGNHPRIQLKVNKNYVQNKAFVKVIQQLYTLDFGDNHAQITKKNTQYTNIYEAKNPKYILEWLANSLCGEAQETVHVQKKIVDESQCIDKNWRRSGFYQIFKYIFHSQLVQELGKDKGSILYKLHMIEFKCMCLEQIYKDLDFDQNLQIMKKISIKMKQLEKYQDIYPEEYEQILKMSSETILKVKKFIDQKWEQCNQNIKKSLQHSIYNKNFDMDREKSQSGLLELVSELDKAQRNFFNDINHSGLFQTGRPYLPYYIEHFEFISQVIKIQQFDQKMEIQWTQLHDIEQLIILQWQNLDIENIEYSSNIIQDLMTIQVIYFNQAQKSYKNNPLGMSMCYLTCVTIYLIIDKISMHFHPYLDKFSIAFPVEILQSLCLRYQYQMEHLNELEKYMDVRNKKAVYSGTFINHMQQVSQYYLSNNKEMNEIKENAIEFQEKQIDKKLEEFDQKYQRYQDLIAQYNEAECDYYDQTKTIRVYNEETEEYEYETYIDTIHSHRCQRCQYKKQADSITISYYEKILPEDKKQIDQVIYELQIPLEIVYYRNSILRVRQILQSPEKLKSQGQKDRVSAYWTQYDSLSQFNNQLCQTYSEIKLVSSSKLFEQVSNYDKKKHIYQYTENSIIVPNGYNLQVYDSNNQMYFQEKNYHMDIKSFCTFKSFAPYLELSKCVKSSDHTQNEAICNMDKVPREVTFNEFLDFYSLRAGCQIQLRNLLKCIESRSLQFENLGVLSLIQQSLFEALQRSSSHKVVRECHQDLIDQQFIQRYYESIEDYLQQIEDNWQHLNIGLVLILVLARISQFSYEGQKLISLIRKFRTVFSKWLVSIQEYLQRSLGKLDAQQVNDIRKNLAQISSFIILTYDFVDEELMDQHLQSEDDVYLWVEANNIYFENLILTQEKLSVEKNYNLLIYSQQKIILNNHILQNIKEIVKDSKFKVLEKFIMNNWSKAQNGAKFSDWSFYDDSNERWVACKCNVNKKENYLNGKDYWIQINLLDGDFIIDGKTIGTLPKQIVNSEVYQRTFKDQLFDVQPDEVYTTKKIDPEGNSFEFSYENSEVKIVQRKQDGTGLELIDNQKFKGLLPHTFVDNYSHWRMGDKIIFRPILFEDSMFKESANSFQFMIDIKDSINKIKDIKHSQTLLDYQGQMYQQICNILSRLELKQCIHIYKTCEDKIKIQLHRMSLQFEYLPSKNQIISEDYEGFFVSENQYIGTMLGMDKGLILENNEGQKQILVPHCEISIQKHLQNITNQHQQVTFNNRNILNPRFFAYEIDEKQKVIKANNQISYLYLAYLLTLTSSSMPNPFNQMTGSQNAIYILKSAFCYSNTPLDKEALNILYNIMKLIPKIDYRSQFQKDCVQIEYTKNLQFLSQNISLYFLCQNIINESTKFNFLYQNKNNSFEDSLPQRDLEFMISYYNKFKKFYPLDQLLSEDEIKQLENLDFNPSQNVLWDNFQQSDNTLQQIQILSKSAFEEQPYYPGHFSISKVNNLIFSQNSLSGYQIYESLFDIDLSIWSGFNFKYRWLQVFNQSLKVYEDEQKIEFGFCLSFMLFKGIADFGQLVNILNIAQHCSNFNNMNSLTNIQHINQFQPKNTYSHQKIQDITKKYRYYKYFNKRSPNWEQQKDNFITCKKKKQSLDNQIQNAWPRAQASKYYDQNNYSRHLDIYTIDFQVDSLFAEWYETYQLQVFIQKIDYTLQSLYLNMDKSPILAQNYTNNVANPISIDFSFELIDSQTINEGMIGIIEEVKNFLQKCSKTMEDLKDSYFNEKNQINIDVLKQILSAEKNDSLVAKDFYKDLQHSFDHYNSRINSQRDLSQEGIQLVQNTQEDKQLDNNDSQQEEEENKEEEQKENKEQEIKENKEQEIQDKKEYDNKLQETQYYSEQETLDNTVQEIQDNKEKITQNNNEQEQQYNEQVLQDGKVYNNEQQFSNDNEQKYDQKDEDEQQEQEQQQITKEKEYQDSNKEDDYLRLSQDEIIQKVQQEFQMLLDQIITYREKIENIMLNNNVPSKDDILNQNLLNSHLWKCSNIVQLLKNLIQNETQDQQIKNIYIAYCLTYIQEKQIQRLINHANNNDFSQLKSEIIYHGHSNWDPYEHPEWVIFEYENDLIIRPLQLKVAQHLIENDNEQQNQVMQLNMGEGKTKVITPIFAINQANGEQIMRISVLNSLFSTNFEDLQTKLGGILGRKMYTFPCNRNLDMDHQQLEIIHNQYKKIQEERSIVITVPEHRLSFKLLHQDYIAKNKQQKALEMQEITNLLDQNCRDLIDESDEILNVKYQLLYTIGSQKLVDGSNQRWELFQIVVKIINDFIIDKIYLQEMYKEAFIDINVKQFQQLFIWNGISEDQYKILCEYVVDHILSSKFSQVQITKLYQQEKQIVRDFILDKEQNLESIKKFEQLDLGASRDIFLILRGLLSYKIMMLILQKRWRIEYGVNTERLDKLMVVPYKAKDVPNPRADFGHPDVAIGLTCMNYYYSGLSYEQLEQLFEYLLQLEQAKDIFQQWVKNLEEKGIQTEIKEIGAINMKNQDQKIHKLYPLFKYNLDSINFWLNNFVFPKESFQFPLKLIANPWDLAQKQNLKISGFSGTNDTKQLLPLSIVQNDLEELLETNIKVISYILQEENQQYHKLEKCQNSKDILKSMVSKNRGQVIIDVGGLILDLSNKQVIEYWLELIDKDTIIQAGVYFDENNMIKVIDRKGVITNFSLSPYRFKLQNCIIYLDEIHTRGTDFKFPINTHGLVTLGLKLQKDKLVQACMRLRQLGFGQSVSFYANDDVDKQIQNQFKQENEQISSIHVVQWTINNSINQIHSGFSQWLFQGINHCFTKKAQILYNKYSGQYNDQKNMKQYLDNCSQKEVYELKDFYGSEKSLIEVPEIGQKLIKQKEVEFPQLKNEPELYESQIVEKLKELMKDEYKEAQLLDEEQERELEQEMEEEKEFQLPNPEQPRVPQLSPQLVNMVIIEHISENDSNILYNLNKCFEKTSLKTILKDDDIWGDELKVTFEYKEVAQRNYLYYEDDDYQRNLSYLIIFWQDINHDKIKQVLFISPFEANKLIGYFRNKDPKNSLVSLHVYSQKIRVHQQELLFSENTTLPHIEVTQSDQVQQIGIRIKLFTCGLFFLDEIENKHMKNYLGVCIGNQDNEKIWDELFDGKYIQKDCFVPEQHREIVDGKMEQNMLEQTKFKVSPLEIIKKLKILRKYKQKLDQFQDILN